MSATRTATGRAGNSGLPPHSPREHRRACRDCGSRGRGAKCPQAPWRKCYGSARLPDPRHPRCTLQPPRGTGDPRQHPPGRLAPLADPHPPNLPAAFRKLDAVTVLAARLLPATAVRRLAGPPARRGPGFPGVLPTSEGSASSERSWDACEAELDRRGERDAPSRLHREPVPTARQQM